MIEIQRILSGDHYHLTMQGHAGTAQRGSDLVCAAASILAYTLAYTAQQGEVKSIYIAEGEADIDVTDAPVESLLAIEQGFDLLEMEYPTAIRVTLEEDAGGR